MNKDIKKEYKDGELNKLKKRIKRLISENKRLKSELNAYDQAFKKTTKFLKDNTKEISIEKLIEAAKSNKSLKEVRTEVEEEDKCPRCTSDTKKVPFRDGHVVVCINEHCKFRHVKKTVKLDE